MTRDYGRIRATFWEDKKIKPLEPTVKMVGAYLLTSQHTNAIGCFKLPLAYVAFDLGLPLDSLEKIFATLRKAGFIHWCEVTPYIWIPNFIRHNPLENPNVWRKCLREFQTLPVEISARAHIAVALYEIALEERMKTLKPEEINRVERFANVAPTIPKPSATVDTPYPCPVPSPEPVPEPEPHSMEVERAVRAAPAKGTRWPPDKLVPEEWIADADIQRHEHDLPRIDLRLEATRFANYWASRTRDAARLDWHKTWINWALDDSKRGTGKANGRVNEAGERGTSTDRHLAGISSLISEISDRKVAGGNERG